MNRMVERGRKDCVRLLEEEKQQLMTNIFRDQAGGLDPMWEMGEEAG